MPGLPTRPVFYDVDLDLQDRQSGRFVLESILLNKETRQAYLSGLFFNCKAGPA